MANPNVTQESIDSFLEHMRTMSAAVNHIQTVHGSMDQTQMYTLITSIKGTEPVPKSSPLYACNPVQVESKSIIYYGSAVGAKRYRYMTAELSLTEFYHTTVKVTNITTSITERSDKS